jgi:hypothetical protein
MSGGRDRGRVRIVSQNFEEIPPPCSFGMQLLIVIVIIVTISLNIGYD